MRTKSVILDFSPKSERLHTDAIYNCTPKNRERVQNRLWLCKALEGISARPLPLVRLAGEVGNG